MKNQEEVKNRVEEQIRQFMGQRSFPYGPDTEEEIQAAEEALGVTFPEQYRWYLRNYGHGGIGGVAIMGATPKAEMQSVASFNLRYREDGLPKTLLAVQNIDEWLDCIDLETGRVVEWDPIGGVDGLEFDSFLEYLEDDFDSAIENIGWDD